MQYEYDGVGLGVRCGNNLGELALISLTRSHLEITAFLASLCKVCSIFQSGIIPLNVNLLNPNPAIHWEDFHLRVPVSPTLLPCQSTTGSSLISLASSGIGGANGHCVVEAPPTADVIVPFWQSGAV